MTDATADQAGTSHIAKSGTPASDAAITARILVTVLLALVGWGLAIVTWGLPGLYLPALAMVPVIFVCLILITVGR